MIEHARQAGGWRSDAAGTGADPSSRARGRPDAQPPRRASRRSPRPRASSRLSSRCRSRRRFEAALGAAGPSSRPARARDLPDQPRQAVQHDLPPLPRRRRARSQRRRTWTARRSTCASPRSTGPTAHTVDITGGAPELQPALPLPRRRSACARGKHVMDRCNLTVLLLPRCADLPEWLAERGVEIVVLAPALPPANTDAQRGDGAFEGRSRRCGG